MELGATEQKIKDFLLQERKEIVDLRDQTNRDFIPLRRENISQRRDLFKHIGLISAGVLGLIGIIFDKQGIGKNYFIIGIILHAAVIILTLAYLRETLDKEGNDLEALQDGYGVIAKEKIGIVEKYILAGDFSEQALNNYFQDLQASNGAQRLEEDIKQQEIDRGLRMQKKQAMDYFGEFIVALFLCGSFYVLISIIQAPITTYAITLITISLFLLPFLNIALKISHFIGLMVKFFQDDGS